MPASAERSRLWPVQSCLLLACLAAPAFAQTGPVPPATYFASIDNLYAGEYGDALSNFNGLNRGSIKSVQSRWIDAICYHAMLGETYYHAGALGKALDEYTSALRLYSSFSDWMLRVTFPRVTDGTSRLRRQIPWGRSTRQFKIANIPDTMQTLQGQINNNNAIKQGGVVQQAMQFPINVKEIVRCTCLALRRRTELLGPLGKHDSLTAELLARLQKRPGPQNWSEAWIDIQLGLAYAANDEPQQASQMLQRGMLLAGEYDHSLSCVAMVELGKLAFAAGDFNAAARLFEEATYSAAYFGDFGVIDEAFRLGQRTHLVSNAPGVYPPLAAARGWAKTNNLRHLEVWLATLLAENLAHVGQTAAATSAIGDAQNLLGRRDMPASAVGAQVRFVSALVSFQRGQILPGMEALNAALDIQRKGSSKWLLQIDMCNKLYANQSLAPRVAMELYRTVLRDPTPADWTTDPFESLSVLAVAHPVSYDAWFDAAIRRKEKLVAIEIADRARRHRFYSSLPLGGRLLNLRAILETPADELPKAAALQRQDLLVRYAKYGELAQKADALKRQLREAPLVPGDAAGQKQQAEKLAELAKLSLAQEVILCEIAVRRDPADLVFPPLRTAREVQEGLPPGHLALVFYEAPAAMHAFLLNSERHAHWTIDQSATFEKNLAKLLREFGNFNHNAEIGAAELRNQGWKQTATALFEQIMRGSEVDLTRGIEELTIVPDGNLWYLPFEALPLPVKPQPTPMLNVFRVRYAPTLSLAVPEPRRAKAPGSLAVAAGKLFPRDSEDVASAAFDEIRRNLPEAVMVRGPQAAPGHLLAPLIDRLIVLDDLEVDPSAPYGWAPISVDHSAKMSTPLADWFPLPAGGPRQIILPGFHTVVEQSLKKRGSLPPGRELFLTSLGLMSQGARTILLSRWRTGGQTAFDLTREFAQELPFTQAADAWQRSVELTCERPLAPELEPRLKASRDEQATTASHPFFWAGYLLVDTGEPPLGDEAAPKPNQDDDAPVIKFKPRPRPDDAVVQGNGDQGAKPEDDPFPEAQPDETPPEDEPKEKMPAENAGADDPRDARADDNAVPVDDNTKVVDGEDDEPPAKQPGAKKNPRGKSTRDKPKPPPKTRKPSR